MKQGLVLGEVPPSTPAQEFFNDLRYKWYRSVVRPIKRAPYRFVMGIYRWADRALTRLDGGACNLEKHALTEFKACGWDYNKKHYRSKDDNLSSQQWVMDHMLDILRVFSRGKHSGSSGHYIINHVTKLMRFEQLVPLTGEDWEWMEVTEYFGGDGAPRKVWQNIRDSSVFKEDDGKGAYDIDGRVYREHLKDGEICYYSKGGERNYIPSFPYTPPETVYIDVDEEGKEIVKDAEPV